MTVESDIYPEQGIVITRVTGSPVFEEIRDHQRALEKSPGFDPDFHHLFDLTEVQNLRVSTEEIRNLASTTLFSPTSRRAVVAPRDAPFGLSRMYEGFSSLPEGTLMVFRSRKEALAWLGISEEEL